MNRELWLATTSDDGTFKATNFLKLIKPPDGTEMTDLVIKLDWNVDTADPWTVNDAKASMLTDGYDWEKRDPGQPLSEDNFRVIYTGGGPVLEFELLEEWMGPALAPGDPNEIRAGVSINLWPPGSLYDKWPINGAGEIMNAENWINVFAGPPISDSEYWFRTTVQKVRDTAISSPKVSKNEHGDSTWFEWTDGLDTIRLFEENADGDPYPLRPRVTYAV